MLPTQQLWSRDVTCTGLLGQGYRGGTQSRSGAWRRWHWHATLASLQPLTTAEHCMVGAWAGLSVIAVQPTAVHAALYSSSRGSSVWSALQWRVGTGASSVTDSTHRPRMANSVHRRAMMCSWTLEMMCCSKHAHTTCDIRTRL